ncbi:MAG: HD domain-containing protein [Lachnospiraceae bacterium]|nr:HD domain-containing protein [Lachnospiraceae bacterium]
MQTVHVHRKNVNAFRRRIAVLIGIAANFLLSFIAYKSGLPMYIDSAGTILVAMLAGVMPAMVTGVATNILCSLFNPNAIYHTFISVLIALMSAWFYYRGGFRKISRIVLYILSLALVSGVPGLCLQWYLTGGPQYKEVSEAAKLISGSGIGYFLSAMLINTGYNVIDKGLTAGLAYAAYRLIPEKLKKAIKDSSWRQKPITFEEAKNDVERRAFHSLKGKMTQRLILAAGILTISMMWISLQLNFNNTRVEYTENAVSAAKFAANIIDPGKVDDYMIRGELDPGYSDVEKMLTNIRDNSRGVVYLYVVKIAKDGCYFVFDLDAGEDLGYEPGEKVDFEEAFLPYVDRLLAGEDIETIESDDTWGKVITSYCPIRNAAGRTIAYAGADVSMRYLPDYVRDYLIKSLLIFSGFFTMVLGYGMWMSRYSLVYPIGSMTKRTKDFAVNSDDQKSLDNSVRAIRDLDIRTDDEVEELYMAICKMSTDMAEQVRSVRHYAAATAKMQNGLIITMADMVENRDSDTGAHIQKTAAYVRIILEGLRSKGYYVQKITPNYISDVEMSAPLHDVGKINISDAVLNKPGKLTEEEYEIMKTHTTAGKKIIEKAINTLQGENYLKEARNMAAYHHERWDGKGYPEKLHGEVIPLSARVMAVADVFDALASPRVYKPAFPFEKAVSIIQEGSGTQFDPKVVEAFLDNLDKVRAVLKKYTQEQ